MRAVISRVELELTISEFVRFKTVQVSGRAVFVTGYIQEEELGRKSRVP
jgi:hypothetical protein